MIDSNKLDSYFDGKRSFDIESGYSTRQGIDWRRLFKIVLPCIAAALLGLMIVMPNIKKSVDLSDNVTMPRKNEMEKLHMEQTVFNITDSKNRVNRVVADSVDETQSGSQIYKIVNPQAMLPTDRGQTDVTAEVGYFNQSTNVLDLENDVKAVVDNDTVITTEKATYDFNNEKGWGKQKVYAKGSWGDMQAESFRYDKIKQILWLEGNNIIKTDKGVLTADKETRIYQQQNRSVSTGNAVVTQNSNKLSAEKLVGWYTSSSKKELERAEAFRDVRLVTAKEIITGNEAYYDATQGKVEIYGNSRKQNIAGKFADVVQGENKLRAYEITAYVSKDGKNELQRVEAEGDVLMLTPTESISGAKGIYEPKSGKVSVFGSGHPVVIKQEDKTLHAQKVEAYLDQNRNLKYAVATGDVEVITPKGSAWGDRGIYNPQEHKVDLYENVRLEQNGNYITGAHAETDLETSISRITGDETTGGRIHGTFYKKRK